MSLMNGVLPTTGQRKYDTFDIIVIVDLKTLRFVYVNEGMIIRSGYTREKLLQCKVNQFNPEVTVEFLQQTLQPLYDGELEAVDIVTYACFKDKEKVMLDAHIELFVRDNNSLGIFLAKDITSQQQIFDELKILSQAVGQSASTIMITDHKGRIEYVNPSFEKLTGYTAREVLGKNPRILKSGEQPAHLYRELWETITVGHKWQGEFHNKRKNGELFWEAACISPIRNGEGKITHFLAVKEDITQKIAAQQAAEQAHAMLREIFNVVGDGLLVIDKNFNIIMANKAFLKIFEVTRQETIGNKCHTIFCGLACFSEKCCLTQTLTEGKKIEVDFERTRKNGRKMLLILTSTPFHDFDGQMMGIVVNVKDVTERYKINRRMHKDFMLAGNIQSSFLPLEINNTLFRIKNIYKPARHVSGDFLDYIWDKDHQVLFGCIVDVMGHGLAAALQTSALRVLSRQMGEENCSLSRKMAVINKESAPYFAADSLAAAIYFELDFQSGQLRYCSGGINYFLHITDSEQKVIKVPGLLLGVMPDSAYEEYSIAFQPGDSFIFLSDGLFDILPEKVGTENFATAYQRLLQLVDHCRDDASAICLEIKK